MKALLVHFGYTEYQASCVAPFMWVVLFLAVAYIVANWYLSHQEKLQKMGPRKSGGSKSGTHAKCCKHRNEETDLGGDRRDAC